MQPHTNTYKNSYYETIPLLVASLPLWYLFAMLTVSEMAKLLEVSKSSIRTWTAEFAQYLSSSAVPTKGEVRGYEEEDVAVLYVVKQLREQRATYEEIHSALQNGAAKSVTPPQFRPITLPQESVAKSSREVTVPVEFLERMMAHMQAQLEMLKENRDDMREELREARQQCDEERAARLEVEKRVAAAEARAELFEKLGASAKI